MIEKKPEVEVASRFDLKINLSTAKKPGTTDPLAPLLRADAMIQ